MTKFESQRIIRPQLFLLFALALLSRCPNVEGQKMDGAVLAEHIILLDKDGKLCDPSSHRPLSSSRACLLYFTNILEHMESERTKSNRTNVLIFIHGGLNTYAAGFEHFKRYWNRNSNDNIYPIFVIWPSGLVSTYKEHLIGVRQGGKEPLATGLATAPFVAIADAGRSLTRSPLVWFNWLRSDYLACYAILTTHQKNALRDKEAKYRSLKDASPTSHIDLSVAMDRRTVGEQIERSGLWGLTLPAKLFTSTWIDGLGQSAWDDMLRRTHNVFPGQYERWLPAWQGAIATSVNGNNALPVFIHLYGEKCNNYQTTLAGHSMGTIIANRMLRHSPIEYANVVYLGAACTIEDFDLYGSDYLMEHTNSQFYNLCLHPVAEARELDWSDLDLAPRGSLLTWIDLFLSDPLYPTSRTLGKWQNMYEKDSVTRASKPDEAVFIIDKMFDPRVRPQIHMRAFSAGHGLHGSFTNLEWDAHSSIPKDQRDGYNWDPQKHGDFSLAKFWDPTFW